jgi:hypothetical protein
MIQGYAIYLRTHRETGKQYGGCVWGSKPNWVAEKACIKRWRAEDLAGIHKYFGGFDSEIVLSEKRENAPEMSERLYQIRIAVDESAVVDNIPAEKKLNVLSPLTQIDRHWLTEEMARLGGKIGGLTAGTKTYVQRLGIFGLPANQWKKIHSDGGRASGILHKKQKIGIFAPDYDKTAAGKIGGKRTHLLHPTLAREWGLKNVASGHLARISCFAAHIRWHVARSISKSTCRFCHPNHSDQS